MSITLAPIPHFLCVGVSHHVTPIDIRERIAISDGALPDAFKLLRNEASIQEAAIINTCNRLEVYAVSKAEFDDGSLERFLHTFHNLSNNSLDNYLYRYKGQEAAKQLFRVATALDALIVGEPQVLGQVKHAYTQAKQHGALGPALHGLFDKAIHAAKRVRTETALSSHAVTVSYAAVELAKQVFGHVQDLCCLIVGAGEMSELAAGYLHQKGVSLLFVNRSLENAQRLANQFEGQAASINQLEFLLPKADMVLTSTASGHILITKQMVKKASRARRYQPMLLIDIAVPRNIDKEAGQLDGIYVYDIDDLKHIVQNNLNQRHQAVEKAESIISQEIGTLFNQLYARQADPCIKQIKTSSQQVVEGEVRKLLSALKVPLNEEDQALITNMGHAIANKILHQPITQIKSAAQEGQKDVVQLAHRLFHTDV